MSKDVLGEYILFCFDKRAFAHDQTVLVQAIEDDEWGIVGYANREDLECDSPTAYPKSMWRKVRHYVGFDAEGVLDEINGLHTEYELTTQRRREQILVRVAALQFDLDEQYWTLMLPTEAFPWYGLKFQADRVAGIEEPDWMNQAALEEDVAQMMQSRQRDGQFLVQYDPTVTAAEPMGEWEPVLFKLRHL